MRKRLLSILLVTVLLLTSGVFSLSASAEDEVRTDLSGKIVVGGWPSGDKALEEIIPAFKEKFPNVEVELNFMSSGDFVQQLQTSVAAGAGAPDVAMVKQLNIGQFKDADGFENLLAEPYNAGQYQDLFPEFKWNLATSTDGEKMIGIVWDVGPATFFYRKDIFEEVGLPSDPEEVTKLMSTWDGYLEVAEKVYIPNQRWLLHTAGALLGWNFLNLDFYDEDLNLKLDTPEARAALETALTIRENGWDAEIVDMWSNEVRAMIGDGSIASMVVGCWFGSSLKLTMAPDAAGLWGVTRIPGGIPDSNEGGSFMVIPSQSQNKEIAWEFIKFALMNPESQNAMFKKVDYFPGLKTAWEDPIYSEGDPYFDNQKTRALWAEIAGNIKPSFATPLNEATYNIMNNTVNAGINEGKTAEEIIKMTEEQILQETRQEREQFMKILEAAGK